MTRAGLSRGAVVALAAGVADEQGLRAVTVSAVARVAGVRPPSIYAHVDGADGLLAGLTTLALEELADRVDRALAGLAGRDALAAYAGAHRAYAGERPGCYEAAGVLGHAVTDALAAAGARHRDQALAVLRGYDVPPDEQVHAVRLVGSTVRGFVQLEAGGAFAHSDPPADASWLRMLDGLDLVLRALAG